MRLGFPVTARLAAALVVLAALPAVAQTPQAGQPPLQRQLLARFQDANSTHDGRLTLAQAQAGGLGWIVRHFGEVDVGSKAYVTLADLQSYRAAHPRDAAAGRAVEDQQTQQQRFLDRFAGANTTGDGKLTLAQATGRMPVIARNFAAIDAAGKGYVTLADIQAWRRSQRAEAPQAAPSVPQTMRPNPAPPNAATGAAGGRQKFIEKFQAANTTGDGRLTLAQAQAGHMPMIAKNFGAIDTAGKGYVTLQDIRAYRQQIAAARPAPPP